MFPNYPKVGVPALNCEKKLVETYIKQKYSGCPDIDAFKIKIKPISLPRYDRPYGKISYYHPPWGNPGCVILHIPKDDLQEFLGTSKNAIKLDVSEDNAQNIVRCIIAHEIAHAFLEYEYGCTDSYEQSKERRTKETERDAFYFTRLLLEHREILYCGDIQCPEFARARANWKKIIEYVYREDARFDEANLKLVLED